LRRGGRTAAGQVVCRGRPRACGGAASPPPIGAKSATTPPPRTSAAAASSLEPLAQGSQTGDFTDHPPLPRGTRGSNGYITTTAGSPRADQACIENADAVHRERTVPVLLVRIRPLRPDRPRRPPHLGTRHRHRLRQRTVAVPRVLCGAPVAPRGDRMEHRKPPHHHRPADQANRLEGGAFPRRKSSAASITGGDDGNVARRPDALGGGLGSRLPYLAFVGMSTAVSRRHLDVPVAR
jgi:hypothetical protein